MFHEHIYGEKKLLTNNAWKQFQEMFTENGFEIYESRGLVEVNIPEKTKAEREAENQHLTVNELLERTCNAYWKTEEEGDAALKFEFIKSLKTSLEPILNM